MGRSRSGTGAEAAEAVAAELVSLGIARHRITLKSNSQSDRPFATVYPADRPEHYVPGSRS